MFGLRYRHHFLDGVCTFCGVGEREDAIERVVQDERELEWWRAVFSLRFVPTEMFPSGLPRVGTDLGARRFKIVEVTDDDYAARP